MPAETPDRLGHPRSWLDAGRYRLLGLVDRSSRESGLAAGLPSAIAGNRHPLPDLHWASLSIRLATRGKALIIHSVSFQHECVMSSANRRPCDEHRTVRPRQPEGSEVPNRGAVVPMALLSDRHLRWRH